MTLHHEELHAVCKAMLPDLVLQSGGKGQGGEKGKVKSKTEQNLLIGTSVTLVCSSQKTENFTYFFGFSLISLMRASTLSTIAFNRS